MRPSWPSLLDASQWLSCFIAVACRAAVELVEKTRALHPASARREAYFQLVQALSQDQLYREALAFAQRCPLGESPEALTDPTLASAFDQPGEGEEGESRLAEAFDLIQEKR